MPTERTGISLPPSIPAGVKQSLGLNEGSPYETFRQSLQGEMDDLHNGGIVQVGLNAEMVDGNRGVDLGRLAAENEWRTFNTFLSGYLKIANTTNGFKLIITADNLTADRDMQAPDADGTGAVFPTVPVDSGRAVRTTGTAGAIEATGITIDGSGNMVGPGYIQAEKLIANPDGVEIYNVSDKVATIESTNLTANRAHELPDADASLAGFQSAPVTSGRATVTSGTAGIIRTSPITIDVANGNTAGVGTFAASGAVSFGGVATGITPTLDAHLATKGYVDSVASGFTPIAPVLASQTTPPGGPSTGQRYRVTATATGAWTGQEDDIATYNGATWDFYTPSSGDFLYDQGAAVQLAFNGSAWVQIGANTTDHGALSGLGDDDHTQYLKTDGSRALTGSQAFGGNDATGIDAVEAATVTTTAAVVTDTISERTAASGVTIDSVLLKDGLVNGIDVVALEVRVDDTEADIATLQSDLSADVANLAAHEADVSNPHAVTKTQVGLANVSNDAQLKIASNLSDLADAAAARNNLGLGDSAILDTGTAAGTVALGDHTHTDATGLASGFMTPAQASKLAGIEALADVTGTANVSAAMISISETTPFAGGGQILWRANSGGEPKWISATEFAAWNCDQC